MVVPAFSENSAPLLLGVLVKHVVSPVRWDGVLPLRVVVGCPLCQWLVPAAAPFVGGYPD